MAIDPSGGVVLAGFDNNRPTADVALARFGATGTLAGLDGDGVVITDTGGTDDFVRSVAIQPDGKIVTAGRSAGEFAINRFTSAGALDTSFSGDGKMLTNFGGTSELATVVDILPNGNIAGAGDSGTGDFAAVRVLTDAPGPTNSASGSAGPGGSVSTNTTVTPADPVGTDVTVPSGGAVTITEVATGTPTPSGFNLLGQQVDITAPAQTAVSPLVLEFHLDASLLPAGVDETNLQVFRNGVAVADCAAGAGTSATPDPCIAIRSESGGDITLTVRTSQASSWNFGVARSATVGRSGPHESAGYRSTLHPSAQEVQEGSEAEEGQVREEGEEAGEEGEEVALVEPRDEADLRPTLVPEELARRGYGIAEAARDQPVEAGRPAEAERHVALGTGQGAHRKGNWRGAGAGSPPARPKREDAPLAPGRVGSLGRRWPRLNYCAGRIVSNLEMST